ncbi:hypothetical protein LCGC14_1686640, partial [marine sediment metagenome]
AGVLGSLVIFIGFIFLFKSLIIGFIVICIGAYFRYKSKTYVHTN